MKIKHVTKWTAIAASVCLMAASASAITVTLGVALSDSKIVGTSIPGVNYGDYGGQINGDVYMANTLKAMALSTTMTDGNGVDFYRSANNFGVLPAATAVGGVIASGGGITYSGLYAVITLTGTGYGYLVAKWDGPNGGAAVWNIAGLAAGTIIQVPKFAYPSNDVLIDGGNAEKYQMTGWALLNPTNTTSVPDGGATVFLLGAALSGLGMMARRFKK